ncbi:hypothetical protein PF005_g3343 [Phytophthora fragariae]|uniref:Uncharacterized protein n=2 Tax=Phytophthora TaxID=4783 RepID=A0A6A3M687_9STRA|nr:hypothetical protein PF003_g15261 [Phytophthora fragariae]KAE9047479.1 hypothetical protein PR002_g1030 [Phytophthora rubi]KAE8946823.1 hypothetical protein PF009_g3560 [Phytophthora fragariae]KAE9026057.1 hypothetical protein PF011_g2754 [Phytophthora fragariae]KAE9052086.1 hypothetical protein PR001_g859 [Phytophthora rubi]
MNFSYDSVADSATTPSFSVGFYQALVESDTDFRASLVQEESRCRYPSKRCEMPRAIKRNGAMHRFCDAHRDRANLNQRRLEARRKREMLELENAPRKRSCSSPERENTAEVENRTEEQRWSEPCKSSPPLHSVLAQDELNFLNKLLSQNSLEDLPIENVSGQANNVPNSNLSENGFAC